MLFKNADFFKVNGVRRPYLPIKIINPATGKSLKLMALIDTGADEVTMPSFIAEQLGHNLKKGTRKRGLGAGGLTTSYGHTTTLEIFDLYDRSIHRCHNIIVDYLVGLHCPLLGVKYFLENFELRVHYPKKIFSIIKIK